MSFSLQNFYSILQLSLSPIVLISACALLCLVFYNRLAVIVARIRSFNKELSEHENNSKHYELIKSQTLLIMKRAYLMRKTLLGLIATILSMLISSIFFSIASLLNDSALMIIGLLFFYLGFATLIIALIFAACELLRSLTPVQLENIETTK